MTRRAPILESVEPALQRCARYGADLAGLPMLAAALAFASLPHHAQALRVATGAVREPRIAAAGAIAFASLAALCCFTAQRLARGRGIGTARWLTGGPEPLARRAVAVVSWTAILCLGIPALQELAGAGAITASPSASVGITLAGALLAAAAVEELLLRALPLELLLAFGRGRRSQAATRIQSTAAVVAVAALAAWLHSPSHLGASTAWLATFYGSKALAAALFAALYLRRGLVEVVLVHAASNLSTALLVPRWVAT